MSKTEIANERQLSNRQENSVYQILRLGGVVHTICPLKVKTTNIMNKIKAPQLSIEPETHNVQLSVAGKQKTNQTTIRTIEHTLSVINTLQPKDSNTPAKCATKIINKTSTTIASLGISGASSVIFSSATRPNCSR